MIAADRAAALLACLVALSAGACIEPRSAVCGDGRICPPGSRCDPQSNFCEPIDCGDGVVSGNEMCDGNDLNGMTCKDLGYYSEDGLACTKTCTFDTFRCVGKCGDGAINGTEQCDGEQLGGADCRSRGFYKGPGLACSSCTFDTSGCTGGTCGDGIKNGPEPCDGAPPSGRTCLDIGFERGLLGCSEGCGLALEEGCANLGWNVVTNTLDTTSSLKSVWGASPDDVFVVGAASTLLHWDGGQWERYASNVDEPVTLAGVWGSGSSDVFAVGSRDQVEDPLSRAVVLHWNGTDWREMVLDARDRSIALTAVWGSGPNDVFVGGGSSILHWDGAAWTRTTLTIDQVRALWGSGPRDVYAAGSAGTAGAIVHFEGTQWSEVFTSATGVFTGIGGTGKDDVFAVGSRQGTMGKSFIVRWNGGAWLPLTLARAADLSAVWGNGPGDVFAVGAAGTIQHWDGSVWADMPSRTSSAFVAVWGIPGNAFAVGNQGVIARWGGATWTSLSSGTTPRNLFVAWASGSDDVFAIEGRQAAGPQLPEGGQLLQWDGTSWTPVVLEGDRGVYAVWGSSPSDVFAVGGVGMIQHWDGARWSAMSSGTTSMVTAVWGSRPGKAFAIDARGLILQLDGDKWTPISPPFLTNVESAWGTGPDDVYAISSSMGPSTTYHWNGAVWMETDLGPREWRSVWGSRRDDVYVVGGGDKIGHWDGTSWLEIKLGTAHDLQVVSGSGAGDVFAAGEAQNALLHLRAGAWEPIALPSGASSHGLWVTPTQVFTGTNTGGIRLDRGSISCTGPERNCDDGWDNDCDGRADAADLDCTGKVPELCANGADDDGDGKTDCADLEDCGDRLACQRRPMTGATSTSLSAAR